MQIALDAFLFRYAGAARRENPEPTGNVLRGLEKSFVTTLGQGPVFNSAQGFQR
jgi:hypothetical protein